MPLLLAQIRAAFMLFGCFNLSHFLNSWLSEPFSWIPAAPRRAQLWRVRQYPYLGWRNAVRVATVIMNKHVANPRLLAFIVTTPKFLSPDHLFTRCRSFDLPLPRCDLRAISLCERPVSIPANSRPFARNVAFSAPRSDFARNLVFICR